MVKSTWVLSQEAFDRLLIWLDSDRDRAGQRYEEIRGKLIRIFVRRGCVIAEDLTDEAINRVSRKLETIVSTYVGDPALYFYGVAQKVHLEYVKTRFEPKPVPRPTPSGNQESTHECLDRCLNGLEPLSRRLILGYYEDDKRAKIDRRKKLAEDFGITLNTLRMRAHRIKAILQQCVTDCLKESLAT